MTRVSLFSFFIGMSIGLQWINAAPAKVNQGRPASATHETSLQTGKSSHKTIAVNKVPTQAFKVPQRQRDDFAEALPGEPAQASTHDVHATTLLKEHSIEIHAHARNRLDQATTNSNHHAPEEAFRAAVKEGKRPIEDADSPVPPKKQKPSIKVSKQIQTAKHSDYKVLDPKTGRFFNTHADYKKHQMDAFAAEKDPHWIEEHLKLIPHPADDVHDKVLVDSEHWREWLDAHKAQDKEKLRHLQNAENKRRVFLGVETMMPGVIQDPFNHLIMNSKVNPHQANKLHQEGRVAKLRVKYHDDDTLKPWLYRELSDKDLERAARLHGMQGTVTAKEAAKYGHGTGVSGDGHIPASPAHGGQQSDH